MFAFASFAPPMTGAILLRRKHRGRAPPMARLARIAGGRQAETERGCGPVGVGCRRRLGLRTALSVLGTQGGRRLRRRSWGCWPAAPAWERARDSGSNQSFAAVAAAQGEFIVRLPADTRLSESALYEPAVEIEHHPDSDLLYMDEDCLDASGSRCWPDFKTGWDPDLALDRDAIECIAAYRRTLLDQINDLRLFPDDVDLALYELSLRFAFAISPRTRDCWRRILVDAPRRPIDWRNARGSMSEQPRKVRMRASTWPRAARRDVYEANLRAEQALTERDAILRERDAILSSTTCRATWPLRMVGDRIPSTLRRRPPRLVTTTGPPRIPLVVRAP